MQGVSSATVISISCLGKEFICLISSFTVYLWQRGSLNLWLQCESYRLWNQARWEENKICGVSLLSTEWLLLFLYLLLRKLYFLSSGNCSHQDNLYDFTLSNFLQLVFSEKYKNLFFYQQTTFWLYCMLLEFGRTVWWRRPQCK